MEDRKSREARILYKRGHVIVSFDVIQPDSRQNSAPCVKFVSVRLGGIAVGILLDIH